MHFEFDYIQKCIIHILLKNELKFSLQALLYHVEEEEQVDKKSRRNEV